MTAALRPSSPPPAPALRAKSLGKLRNPARFEARKIGVAAMYRATQRISDSQLGERLGGADDGAQVRTGALVLTTHEAALLLPFDVFVALVDDALRSRIVSMLAANDCASDSALRLRLALTHLDALAALRLGA